MQRQTQRMTKQRRIILEEIRNVRTHPTADELYQIVRKRLPCISLGTVYRNLELLATNGDILKISMAGNQKRFDGTAFPHSHVHCTRCGAVADVESAPSTDHVDLGTVTAPNFSITHSVLNFYGVCSKCASHVPPQKIS